MSLHSATPALTLAFHSGSDIVEKVDGAKDVVKTVHDKVTSSVPKAASVPHVGRDAAQSAIPDPLVVFLADIEAPLAKCSASLVVLIFTDD